MKELKNIQAETSKAALWLNTETFNRLLEKSKTKLTLEGILEISEEPIKVKVKFGHLIGDDGESYVEVQEILEYAPYTNLPKRIIYKMPEKPKFAKII